MLRANGEGMPVGDGAEIRAGVAIMGSGADGAVAALVIGQQAPELCVVIIEGQDAPQDGRTLTPVGPRFLQEVGLEEGTAPSEVIERAVALGATLLRGVTVARTETSAGRIDRLRLSDGRAIVADWYIDTGSPTAGEASGENCLSCGNAGSELIGFDAACTVAALHRGGHDLAWLRWSFHETTRRRLNDLERRAADQALEMHRYNIIKPNLVGAQQGTIGEFRNGKVHPIPCYKREGRALPIGGVYAQLLEALKHHTVVADVLVELQQPGHPPIDRCIDGLESMLQDGWLIGRLDRRRPLPEWSSKAKPSAIISTFTPSREQIRK